MQKKVGIIGGGRLGEALAKELIRKEVPLMGITCKHFERAKKVARSLGVSSYDSNMELAQESDVLFVTTPDGVIRSVFQEMAEATLGKNLIVIHCSGAFSAFDMPEVVGVQRGSFHPLQTFAGQEVSFQGLAVAMDGEGEAFEYLQYLGELLQVVPLWVPAEERSLYHGAACMISNYTVTLLGVAADLFGRWTSSPEMARQVMGPLVQASVENFQNQGALNALTGPIIRGDTETITKHLAVLAGDSKQIYQILGLAALDLAKRSGKITVHQADPIANLLKREGKEP